MSSLGFSPLLPDLQRDFNINYSQVGLFSGVYGLAAIAFSIPGGVLARRFGEKKVLTLGLLVVTSGLGVLSRAPNFAWGLSGRTIWIIGYRVAFVCVMTAVARVVPSHRRSIAMGILGAMSSLASVVGAPFGASIGVAFGWRNGILAFAGMALLGSIVFWALYRSPGETVRPSATEHGLGHGPEPVSLVHGPVRAHQHGRIQCHVFRSIRGNDDVSSRTNRCGLHHQCLVRDCDLRKSPLRLLGRSPESLGRDDRHHAAPDPGVVCHDGAQLRRLPLRHSPVNLAGLVRNEPDFCDRE